MVDFNKLRQKMREDQQKTPDQLARERADERLRVENEYKKRDDQLLVELDRLIKDSRLNQWERGFVRDMHSALRSQQGAYLTDAQIAKIHALNTQYAEDTSPVLNCDMRKEAENLLAAHTGQHVVIVEQDRVELYAAEINEILALVGHSLDTCVVTNESSLYDFSTCYPESEEPEEPVDMSRMSRQDQWQWHVEHWDEWIRQKWMDTYPDIPFGQHFTDSYLVSLAERLREMRDRHAEKTAGANAAERPN